MTTRAGTSLSKHHVAQKAAQIAAAEALDKAHLSKATTAIVFATSDHHSQYPEILKQVKQITGADQIIGASGSGVLTESVEIERQPGVAVMVMDSDDIQTASFLIPNLQENNFKAGETLGRKFIETGIQPDLLLLFPDAFSFQSHFFFDGLENAYGYIPIAGGTAAENSGENRTYQMEGNQVTFDAVSALAFQGNFRTEIGVTHSCQPFGESHQVTRAHQNTIYELNGRPAYDVFLDSLSQVEFKNPNQILQRVFLGLPVRSFQTDFIQSPYLVRNIMGVNAQKGVLNCVSPVPEGEFITFTMQDPELSRQNLNSMLEDMKSRLGHSKPFLGFYFNCCARGEMLYGAPNQDTAAIRHFFPNVPILGFYSYGELAPVDHVNYLHQYSGILVLLADR